MEEEHPHEITQPHSFQTTAAMENSKWVPPLKEHENKWNLAANAHKLDAPLAINQVNSKKMQAVKSKLFSPTSASIHSRYEPKPQEKLTETKSPQKRHSAPIESLERSQSEPHSPARPTSSTLLKLTAAAIHGQYVKPVTPDIVVLKPQAKKPIESYSSPAAYKNVASKLYAPTSASIHGRYTGAATSAGGATSPSPSHTSHTSHASHASHTDQSGATSNASTSLRSSPATTSALPSPTQLTPRPRSTSPAASSSTASSILPTVALLSLSSPSPAPTPAPTPAAAPAVVVQDESVFGEQIVVSTPVETEDVQVIIDAVPVEVEVASVNDVVEQVAVIDSQVEVSEAVSETGVEAEIEAVESVEEALASEENEEVKEEVIAPTEAVEEEDETF